MVRSRYLNRRARRGKASARPSAPLDKTGLARRYALTVSPFALRRKLRCGECGERLASWAIA